MPIQFGSHKILHLGVLLLGCISGVCPANIVILHPAYSGSHHIALRNFGDHLVSRGHNVTQIKFRMSNANHVANTQVNILDLALQDPEGTCAYVNHQGEMEINKEVGQLLWNRGADLTTLPRDLFCLAGVHCQSLFYDPDVIRLFNETRFDLAIVDLIANECGVALAKSVHVPIVTFWGFSFQGGEVALTSNFNNPAIVPTFFSALGIRMNFLERTYNFVLSMIHYGFEVRQANIAQGFISERFPDLPPVGQMIHDLDMHFVNTDFYVDTPKAMSPNTKYIGGIHLREGHPLPQEYDDFYRDAHHGVILFSMGYTGFHPEAVPSSVIANFLTAFGRLQQKVIVKYDKDFIPFTPSNVMVVDWVPQQDILDVVFTYCVVASLITSQRPQWSTITLEGLFLIVCILATTAALVVTVLIALPLALAQWGLLTVTNWANILYHRL
ncbi:UDP-glucosyltransferase 2-like isoform X2 [Tigriopus californicus]|uniref:UDP-glucosyltransferase 2-like isoform X2 n=1 Tax=Tigriopus californicus TaxID=6832 RepID=UPI0027DA76FB|nr:UDP-glucosyltransferase 2-like isoform X2 [Tigriopus californicus]